MTDDIQTVREALNEAQEIAVGDPLTFDYYGNAQRALDRIEAVVKAAREELVGPGLGGSGSSPYPSALRSCPKTVAALSTLDSTEAPQEEEG